MGKKEPVKQSAPNLLHPLLKKVSTGLIKDLKAQGIDARLIETSRTQERQQYLFNKKASKTLKSKHLTGRAFDIGRRDQVV